MPKNVYGKHKSCKKDKINENKYTVPCRDGDEKHFAALEGNGPWDTLQTIAKTIENNQKCIGKLSPSNALFGLLQHLAPSPTFGTS